MLYLLDANVLITAKNLYYEFGRVDQYWEWLAFQAEQGNAKIPLEIYEEITVGKDRLAAWAKNNKDALVLGEEVDIALVQHVTMRGYAPDLNDIELEEIGRDPFLIAYALADSEKRVVVTGEVRSNKKRQNRSIPSVCDELGVRSCDQWAFGRHLDFRTDWKRP
jgi:Domain of unknown function (DUF4411)